MLKNCSPVLSCSQLLMFGGPRRSEWRNMQQKMFPFSFIHKNLTKKGKL